MNIAWYLSRLEKMSLAEVNKRFGERLWIYYSRVKFRNATQWPYSRFSRDGTSMVLYPLPGVLIANDWRHYQIYNTEFDLTKTLDWHYSGNGSARWPTCHFAKINYRPGNPYGDVRFNWELNRLQFLPQMALTDEDLAKRIISDWLIKNPYLYGPGYSVSMEVALRWFSIYWAVCLFEKPMETSFIESLKGLAVASGEFIESRLSTHSSAGNHLVVEAVGLFWLGKALENNRIGSRWKAMARKILSEQIHKQINPDGSNQEQSFWYLGFVLDALFHYILLEERAKIPAEVWEQVERTFEFVDGMVLPDGSFPDYGDRDDGFVSRINGAYDESPFPGLINIGSFFFNRPEWYRDGQRARERLSFWTGKRVHGVTPGDGSNKNPMFAEQPLLKTYNDGGMTLMRWGKGRLLFRHSLLGLGNTCGHGHSDALSVLFSWANTPVLIDLGSGQYNGDQQIRNYFRSTIAHNTVEIGRKNQARILGPFMWEKSYEAWLEEAGESPVLYATASHNGYMDEFSVTHTRRVVWLKPHQLEIRDSFSGYDGVPMRGAFHFGACRTVIQKKNVIEADFDNFMFSVALPPKFSVEVFYGTKHPFMGWRSAIYGKWEPIHSIVYSSEFKRNCQFKTILRIIEK